MHMDHADYGQLEGFIQHLQLELRQRNIDAKRETYVEDLSELRATCEREFEACREFIASLPSNVRKSLHDFAQTRCLLIETAVAGELVGHFDLNTMIRFTLTDRNRIAVLGVAHARKRFVGPMWLSFYDDFLSSVQLLDVLTG